MEFKGKVVLVTGSSRGIGKEIVYQFAREGAFVVINYNNSEKLALELMEQINSEFNTECMCIKCDISNEEEVKNMISSVVSRFGKIDILVNNASICNDNLFLEKDVSSFRRILEVNLIGTYLVSRCSYNYMKEGASIINISSDNAIDRYYPESCDYDASKAGVISLSHNMAREFKGKVRVNAICPGWIDTDMNNDMDSSLRDEISDKILVGRFGTCLEVANLVLFLASSKASFINDSVIKINGGILNE